MKIIKSVKRIVFTISLIFVLSSLKAQYLGNANNTGSLQGINDIVRERNIEENMLKDMKYSRLNYFLDKDWTAGVLYTKDGTPISGMLYRYNIYTDQIEYRSFINPEAIDVISIGSKKFIYTEYVSEGQDYNESGYFELVVNGDCKLLIKRQMMFKEGTNDQEAYGSGSSTKIIERYYVKKGNEPAVYIEKNKASLEKLLSDKDKFESYINDKLLLIITEKKLIELITYYNEI